MNYALRREPPTRKPRRLLLSRVDVQPDRDVSCLTDTPKNRELLRNVGRKLATTSGGLFFDETKDEA